MLSKTHLTQILGKILAEYMDDYETYCEQNPEDKQGISLFATKIGTTKRIARELGIGEQELIKQAYITRKEDAIEKEKTY